MKNYNKYFKLNFKILSIIFYLTLFNISIDYSNCDLVDDVVEGFINLVCIFANCDTKSSTLPTTLSSTNLNTISTTISPILPSTKPTLEFPTMIITSIPITPKIISLPITINTNVPENINYETTIKNKDLEPNLNITKEEILNNITDIIKSIEIGENYRITGNDFDLIIKPTNSSFLENSTHVNFKNCENILRKKFNIPLSRIITFLQLEIYSKNSQSFVNKIEYQAYDDNKNILDLSICNDTEIQIFYSIKNNSYDFSDYNSFKNKGIDIFNINDSFFNDICKSFSDSKNDLVLEDRIKEIYQNYSVCDDNCIYSGINFENKIISCDCKIKTNLSVEEPSLNLKQFDEIEIESNFGLIKCYHLVFSWVGKLNNIGFWIFLILVFIHIPCIFIHFYKGIKPIQEYLQNEMKNYGYIKIPELKKKKSKGLHSPLKKQKGIKKINDNSSVNKLKLSKREIINNINKTGNKKIKIKSIKNITGKGNLKKIFINNIIMIDKSKDKIRKNKMKNIDILPTQGIKSNNKNENNKRTTDENNEKNNTFNFNLININLNDIKDYKPKSSLHILNIYTFEEAIKYDLRSICAIFYIFLLSKQAIFHAFLFKSPLELFPLRFCLLIFIISSDLALNAIFYLDDKISKKYRYAKNIFLFTFNNNITIILLSTLIGFIFLTLFTNLGNSTNKIRDVFRKVEEKIKHDKKFVVTDKNKKKIIKEIKDILNKHRIKTIILITSEFSLMLFFWYYVTAFCHVYSNTQLSWLLDSFLSILSRLIIELLLSLGFAKLYRIAVEANIHFLYKIVIFFYCLG